MFSRSKTPFSSGSVVTLLKAAVGGGLLIVALGLILFVNESLAKMAMSTYLQLAADGLVVIAMSFFAIKVWRKLEFV